MGLHTQAVPLDVLEALAQDAAAHAAGPRPAGVWAAWQRATHGADHPAGAKLKTLELSRPGSLVDLEI